MTRMLRQLAIGLAASIVAIGSSGIAGAGAVLQLRRAASLPSCALAQLNFAYFGASTATGTVINGFEITNSADTRCQLIGRPNVQFFVGSAHPSKLTPRLSHVGPGVAFPKDPVPIALEPRNANRAITNAAGFVFTSRDFAANGSGNCPQITSVVISLTGAERGDRVNLWYPTNACGTPPGVNTSAFFGGADLDRYITAAIPPLCSARDLLTTLGKSGIAPSHISVVIVFRNVGAIPCRLRGYPTVRAVASDGHQAITAVATPEGYSGGLSTPTTLPPLVEVNPGQTASAMVGGTDRSGTAGKACPTYLTFLVTAPYSERAVRVPIKFAGCSDFQAHPVVPGPTGSLQRGGG